MQQFLQLLAFWDEPEVEDFFNADKWMKVRVLVSSFNDHMGAVFSAGDQVLVSPLPASAGDQVRFRTCDSEQLENQIEHQLENTAGVPSS